MRRAVPQKYRGRVRDRRRNRVTRMFFIGVVTGFCLSTPVSVWAQGATVEAWLQPSVVLSILAVVLSVGGAWQMVADDRRRIALLEASSVRQDVFTAVLGGLNGKVDRIDAVMTRLSETSQGRH